MTEKQPLPAQWCVTKLPEVAYFQEGPGLRKFQFRETGIPFLNIRTLTGQRVDKSKCQYLDEEEVARQYSHFLVEAGDIICSSSGTLGKTAVIQESDKPLMLNTSVIRFRPHREDVLSRGFLLTFLNSQVFLRQARAASTGSAQVNFGPSHLKSFDIPFPPVNEQRRIVAKIEELFSELDKGIENLKQARAQLAVYRQALLKHAFEGKLTAAWRAAHKKQLESADKLLARIRTELPPESGNLVALGTNECGWLKLPLREIAAEALIGLVRASALQNGDGRGFSYIKMDRVDMCGRVDIDPNVFVECSPEEVERFALRAGDILFNTRNSLELVGKTGLVRKSPTTPTVFNNNLMRIRPVTAVVPAFLNYQMCAPDFRNKMEKVKKATTSVAAVYGKDLWPITVVIPSTAEQQQIVVELDRQLDAIEQMESDIDTNLQKSEALRQSILKKAFAGELVPQDPNDEPAATLLARIRAEREAQAKASRNGRAAVPGRPNRKAAQPLT